MTTVDKMLFVFIGISCFCVAAAYLFAIISIFQYIREEWKYRRAKFIKSKKND